MTAQKIAKKRKPGGGRKPKAATVLKRRLIENKLEEFEASFAFLVAVRDNPREPIAQRVAAAIYIMDRVMGKPKEHTELSGEVVVKGYVSVSPDDWNEQPSAHPAP